MVVEPLGRSPTKAAGASAHWVMRAWIALIEFPVQIHAERMEFRVGLLQMEIVYANVQTARLLPHVLVLRSVQTRVRMAASELGL